VTNPEDEVEIVQVNHSHTSYTYSRAQN